MRPEILCKGYDSLRRGVLLSGHRLGAELDALGIEPSRCRGCQRRGETGQSLQPIGMPDPSGGLGDAGVDRGAGRYS